MKDMAIGDVIIKFIGGKLFILCLGLLMTCLLPFTWHNVKVIFEFGQAGGYWCGWELNILRNYYSNSPKEFLLELLPHRTWRTILKNGEKMGLIRDPKFSQINHFTSKNNPMHNPIYKKKAWDKLKRLYKEHPETLLNSRLKRDKMTNIEKKMASYLDELGIKYEWNKYVKTINTFRFPDFKIGNLIIECDGLYWHKY